MDKILESTGAFGAYQIGMIALMGGISSLSSMCIYASVFTAAESELLCKKAGNLTVTEDDEKCSLFFNASNFFNSSNVECKYDETYYGKTVVTEWNLICDRNFLVSITQTSHMIGAICSFFTGYFGDRYGRRKTTLSFLTLLCLTLIVSEACVSPMFKTSVMTRYVIYTVGQFLTGMLVNCCYCIAYVLLLELTNSKHRTQFSNINSYIYVIGELNVMFGYYFTKNWHSLNWFITIYSLVCLIMAFIFIDESPQWLISMQHYDQAHQLLVKIAKTNKRKANFLNEYSKDLSGLQLMNDADEDSSEAQMIKVSGINGDNDEFALKASDSEHNSNSNTFLRIFYPRKVFIKTMLLIYVWNALNLLYYGISLGITSINAINPYYMFFFSCICELVGVYICRLNDVYGRRKTFSGFLIVSSVTCLIVALIPHDFELNSHRVGITANEIIIVVFALIGKGAISGAYNIIYIYTSELYTTNVRNTAVLFLVCVGSAGSFIAPQINYLRSVWTPFPYMTFSASAILACVCVLFLPETQVKE